MNKVENVEEFSNDSKPLEMLSEQEKNTQSEMRPDEITTELGEGDPSKKPSEETPEPEVEVPEEELKKGEELEPKVEEKVEEKVEPVKVEPAPEPTPKSSEDTEDRETKGLKDELLRQIIRNRSATRKLVNPITPSEPIIPQTTDEEGIDPEVEQQLEAILQKKGYVPETQIREKMQQETLDNSMNNTDKEFFGKYPEYLYSQEMRNEHDEIVNAVPAKTAEEYQKRMGLAHDIVKQNHPDRFPSSSGTDIAKKQEALKDASLGAGSQSAPSNNQPAIDPQKVAEARRFYKGYTDDEIAKLLTK